MAPVAYQVHLVQQVHPEAHQEEEEASVHLVHLVHRVHAVLEGSRARRDSQDPGVLFPVQEDVLAQKATWGQKDNLDQL